MRLGLLLSEIGTRNGVEVSQQEMSQLIMQAAQQYRPEDREKFVQYIQQEPMAAAQLRAPLFEDKVVDFLFSKAEITDRTVTREQLEAEIEADLDGHVHGPDCDHGHGAKPKAKAKKVSAKKTDAQPTEEKPAKKAAPKKAAVTEAPAKEPKADKAAAKKAPAKKAAPKK